MYCPRCGKLLSQDNCRNTITFACPDGCGRYMTLAGLRKCGAEAELINVLWSNARNGNSIRGLPCPNCKQAMRQLKIGDEQIYFDLDICTVCQSLWFDAGELEHIPVPDIPEQPVNPELKNLEPITTGYDHLPDGDGPDQFWKYLPAVIGLPVEQYTFSCKRLPILTWLTAFCCTALYVLFSWQGNLEYIIDNWGFIPSQWLRHDGLTVWSSMFLHADILHLLGNMYFLIMCGDNAEDVLGHGKFLLLVVLSGCSALILYGSTALRPDIPLIGASGFISGIIAFYAIRFPHVAFSFCLLSRSPLSVLLLSSDRFFFSIPAWVWFLLYAIGQILYAVFNPGGYTAYTAHLGGFVPGIIWALIELKRAGSVDSVDEKCI